MLGLLSLASAGELCQQRDPESAGLAWPQCPWGEGSCCPQAGTMRGRHSSVPAAAPAFWPPASPGSLEGQHTVPMIPALLPHPRALSSHTAARSDCSPCCQLSCGHCWQHCWPSLAKAARVAQLSITTRAFGVIMSSLPSFLPPTGVWQIPPAFGEDRRHPHGHRGHDRRQHF